MSGTQLNCGELKSQKTKDGVEFTGKVRLIGRLSGELKLTKHARSESGENAPDYAVFFRDASGSAYNIGSAWLKNNPRVGGGDFLTMTLAHPDWPEDVSLAAFPDGDVYRMVWSRPRGQARAQQPEQVPA
jgi:uncharacterized protein (DUF736 family)